MWIPVGRRSVITVPAASVHSQHGLDTVRIRTDGGEADVAVVLGETFMDPDGDGASVEVLSGLRDGDRVLVP